MHLEAYNSGDELNTTDILPFKLHNRPPIAPSSKILKLPHVPSTVSSKNSMRSASPNSLNIADALYQLKRGKDEDDDRHFQSISISVENSTDDPVTVGWWLQEFRSTYSSTLVISGHKISLSMDPLNGVIVCLKFYADPSSGLKQEMFYFST